MLFRSDDNMPNTFPPAFLQSWKTFKGLWQDFTDAQTASGTGAVTKVDAINTCYQKAIDMGAIGQLVFKDNDELKKQFSFEAMGALVEPAGPASLEVTVKVNGIAKPGAEVSIEGTDKELVTDAEGKVLFTQMSEGALQCHIECDGFTAQTVSETLSAGVRKRITVTLQPLFEGALNVGSQPVENPQPMVGNPQ